MSFSALSCLASQSIRETAPTGPPAPPPPSAYAQLIAAKQPWGLYEAKNAVNNTQLPDTSGNNRHATMSGSISRGTASGNGATASIAFVNGANTTTTIRWPDGSLPTDYTLCSITRTINNGDSVLQGYTLGHTFVHGHSLPSLFACRYRNGASSTTASGNNNWVVTCGKRSGTSPNHVLRNGVAVGNSSVNSAGSASAYMGINIGGTNNPSTFGFNTLIIWNQILTDAELATVSAAMIQSLTTGTLA